MGRKLWAGIRKGPRGGEGGVEEGCILEPTQGSPNPRA